jgi:RecA-family ATPase
LIVIDTLLMITPPINDSPYANDYNNIVALKKFADKYEIAIVLIHHTRKLKAKDPFDEILGTSGLNGAADVHRIEDPCGRLF